MPKDPSNVSIGRDDKNSATHKVVAATIIGIVFIVVLLLLALFIPTPTKFQYEIFRVVLALAAAGFAAILPGAISAKLPWGIGAVGSLAVFSIVYFFSPAKLIADTENKNTTIGSLTFAEAAECHTEASGCPENINEMEVFLESLPEQYRISSQDTVKIKLGELIAYKEQKDIEIKELSALVGDLITPDTVAEFVKKLEPDDPQGKELKLMSTRSEGPWRPSTKARPVAISVPGRFMEGKNYSCPEYFRENIEFRSNLVIENELLLGEPSVTLKINGTLSSASNCRDIISYDFQLSCIDAKKIYSSKALECDENNNPLWKIDKKHRIMPAYATIIYANTAGKAFQRTQPLTRLLR